ncbi:leucine-rich repeat and fibronectin type III domain-containing protein 1-like protein isoform X2 [Danaus plexippus]|uniref:leucine-rich repeat and fibronectin type III domain-containing protein 1-like protein isoform X2 n=1 Tax=Danaus plexippus TaxID=13037 RepID=UPI002AAF9F7E|nr:leucine-rich repeat and fibronectin type III domain-containing protein 1-like protein isoform X2 [Danaus plexippus]
MWVLLMLALAVAVSAECPRHCECKWRSGKESALCARAGLNAIPPRLDPTTQLLDLAENRISVLKDDAFAEAGLLNLQRLYIPACNLKSIRQYAFRALVNLVELDLSRNRLETVPSQAFESIPELRELRLSGNPIVKIKDDAFLSLPHLVKLTLSDCKIIEIEHRGFKGLEGSLEYLELNKNKLQILHVAILAPLRSLKGLELANNPWDCNCALRPMRDWMIRKNVPATVVPDCALPPRLTSQSWDRLDLEDFACLPEVTGTLNNIKGIEGEEVTLICQVSGVPAPRVRWIRSGRLLANTTISSNLNSGRIFLLRSEGQTSNLTIKSADIQDSGQYTCNAENRAENNSRKRGDYRNVPSDDPEDEYEGYGRDEVNRKRSESSPPRDIRWRRIEYDPPVSRAGELVQDLHIPRLREYNSGNDATSETIQTSKSAGLLAGHVEILSENNRFNNNARSCPRPRARDRLDNDLSGSDSEKNYPDLIEMSALGTTSYYRGDIKHDPYYFYTIPRRKDGDSRSPLLSSRRNSSGGDSITFLDKSYDKSQQRSSGRRSNSFLDLSVGGNRMRRNPSLPASPSREQSSVPSATPLLDLSGLRDYSRTGQPFEDFDFRASQLEKFLEEYRSLREQLSRMKETRENLQRTRAVESEELRTIHKGKPSIAVTETSSSVTLADASSPLALSPSEYKPQHTRPEWLTTLLYRN